MNAENPLAVRVLLGFLKAGRVLDAGSSVLLLGTLVLAGTPLAPGKAAAVGTALLLGLLAKYYAWRVALDAEFFALLSEQPQQAGAFDGALADFMGRTTAPPRRTMDSRWQGARRLVKRQAAVVVLQALAVVAAAIGQLLQG